MVKRGVMTDKEIFKRTFDIISISLFLIPMGPVILVIMGVLKITYRQNIFFLQERIGKDGKPFKMIKFRTMVEGAVNKGKGIFVEENDNRITPVGHILRKFSLDELPQLINVLKGEMSIIGPRPPLTHYPYKYDDYPAEAKKRFLVKPGLTGLAQVMGRKELDWKERFPFDSEYASNYSFWMDVVILLKSILVVIKRDNIYGRQ